MSSTFLITPRHRKKASTNSSCSLSSRARRPKRRSEASWAGHCWRCVQRELEVTFQRTCAVVAVQPGNGHACTADRTNAIHIVEICQLRSLLAKVKLRHHSCIYHDTQ